jgi:hypothetical protein
MTAAGGGGGGFEGIDPPLLSQLMQSMKSGVGAGAPVAAGYMSRFTALGIDTSRISRLQQDYNWAQGQQSMLQRRYDLASHQPSGQWVNGMATSGAGELEYTTPRQAQQAGANAAKELQDGKISYAEFMAMLREHEYDPDWQTGAMRTLGEQGLWNIYNSGVPEGNSADMKALALAVAAGMANGVTYPDPDDPETGSVDMVLIAPLLQYANFPPQVLATLGRENMNPLYNPEAQEVWAALAANPEAAALFVQQNASLIVNYVSAGNPIGIPGDQVNAFLAVLNAGTIGIKKTDAQLGGQAVTALIEAYDNDQGAHASGPFDALYGKVIEDYWPDVMFSITSTASDPHGYLKSPDGMHLSPNQWAAFVREAMWDPTTAAGLLAYAHAQEWHWYKEGYGMPGNSGDSYGLQAGLVGGFFDAQATSVYNQQGSNAGAWKSGVDAAIGPAVSATVNIIADPGQAAATLVTSAISFFSASFLTGVVNGLPSGGPTPPALSTWQQAHESGAVFAFDNATPQLIKEDDQDDPADLLQGLVDSAKKYDNGSFVVPGNPPQIMPVSKMTPQELQAYNAWLNDPAVMAKTLNEGVESAWSQGYYDYTGQEKTSPQ